MKTQTINETSIPLSTLPLHSKKTKQIRTKLAKISKTHTHTHTSKDWASKISKMVGGLKSFRTAWHQTSESSNKPPVVWKNTDSLGAFRRFWLEPKSVLPKHRTLGITPEIGVLINRRHLWGWIPNLPKNALGINHQILRWFLRLGCEKITSKTHNLYRFQQTILSLGEARMPCRELFVKTEKAKAKNNTSNRAGIYIYIYTCISIVQGFFIQLSKYVSVNSASTATALII